ncbi:hypothetical protein [Streptomyces griseoloalbus]|uniref:Uncharacterized protein n=1 Tax=Streptomyces griseoloalbus TaxID=67303 RepID=A0A7W8BVF9_9ACTN|nr:hypothetical protein [Streptomyces albaduncus]MBB5130296.1 hypothetical protein [Streptomyces albaduncus]GGW82447.1 hypothetical protein GCM10010340_70330 [Streptomyces albaduncus]
MQTKFLAPNRAFLSALAATAVLGGPLSATADAAPAKYQTHAQAAAVLKQADISWSSSGGCSNRENSRCTSFTKINKPTIAGLVAFKKASRCAVRVTGGTERGHASGTYSHYNGYKADIALNSCVNKYITSRFKHTGKRSDGATLYKSPAGNVYAREGNHWDITYYNSRA